MNLFSLTTAIQRGSAVWTAGTHAIPDPIWPALEDVQRRIRSQPTVDLNTNQYRRDWAYFFTNNVPFVLPPDPGGTAGGFIFDRWTNSDGSFLIWQDGSTAAF